MTHFLLVTVCPVVAGVICGYLISDLSRWRHNKRGEMRALICWLFHQRSWIATPGWPSDLEMRCQKCDRRWTADR